MTENKDLKEGWLCPRCGSVNAPDIEKCKCVKTEDTNKDNRQLLTESNDSDEDSWGYDGRGVSG